MAQKKIYKSKAEREKAYRLRHRKNPLTPDEVQQKRREAFIEAYKPLLDDPIVLDIEDIKNNLTLLLDWLEGLSHSQIATKYGISKAGVGQKIKKIENLFKNFTPHND
jgi:predicted DNA-binding protein YlxM (UPF0122 family)